jgi:hypothetical protein
VIMDDDTASTDCSLLSSFDSDMPFDDGSAVTLAHPASTTPSPSPAPAKVIAERKVKAVQTWSFARPPSSTEPKHDAKGHRIWYCKYRQCSSYRAISTTNARAHLRKTHGITQTSLEWLLISSRSQPCLQSQNECFLAQEGR